MATVTLPHNFVPRGYQLPFLAAMRTAQNPGGVKRADLVWHRRTGKDKTCLNYLIPRMVERIGAYYYYFPTAAMGRDILWDGMDRDGYKFMDHFPSELIKRTNSTEMLIELINGTIFKIRGTDKREPIGVNPVGCVFSEFSRQNPSTGWDLVRPILAENDGWAVFNYTPRGKNHAYRLHRLIGNDPDWFSQLLTVNDTHAISQEAIELERKSGMSEEMIQQEFYCSFMAGVEGSYYGRSMAQLWDWGQIGNVPHEPKAGVYTAWDLGIGDPTAIWCFQLVQHEIRFIDYYETHGEGLNHYREWLQSKPYRYIGHWLPHDASQRKFQADGTVKTVYQIFCQLFQIVDPYTGIKIPEVGIVAPHRISVGIEEVRGLLQQKGKIWFNKETCEHGIDALENYHASYNERLQAFGDNPEHDWSSHGASGFKEALIAYRYHIRDAGGDLIGYPKAIAEDHDLDEDESDRRLDYYKRRYR